MKKLVYPAAILTVLVVSALAGYFTFQKLYNNAGTLGARSDSALDFRFPDLQGQTRSLSDWDGQFIVINFWASWCAPCLKEIPDFVRLQEELAGARVQFVGIAVDSHDAVNKFITKTPVNYPILIGQLEALRLVKAFGNESGGLPYTIFVSRHGEVVYRHQGPLTFEEAHAAINRYL